MYDIWQALPGQTQTVDRGELQALLLTVANVEIGGTVDFFTESKITHDTFYKGIGRARFSNSADMWVQVFKYIGMKGLHVTLYWMPSHTDTAPKKLKIAPKWLKPWHVAANKKADGLAGTAAASHAIAAD